MKTIVSSPTKEVIIGDEQPTRLIGERINPAGRKKFQELLKSGDLSTVAKEAVAQTEAGADILDVCVGTFGVDEVDLLPKAVAEVVKVVDTPLCLDSANPDALAAALKVYKGKALINSVSGEEHSMEKVLPLVKQYGAAVVGLVQDDDGIPQSAEKRVEIAEKIITRAEALGIPREDIVIDVETFSVGADQTSGPKVLDAIRMIKEKFGVNITLAVSNVSFGLPERAVLNNAFTAQVVAAGATCLITDAAKVRTFALAADLILGQDKRARRFVEFFRNKPKD